MNSNHKKTEQTKPKDTGFRIGSGGGFKVDREVFFSRKDVKENAAKFLKSDAYPKAKK